MFEKIKKFYRLGLYSKAQVWQFVLKDKITDEQYREIIAE